MGRNRTVSKRMEARAEHGCGCQWRTADSASGRTRALVAMVRVKKRVITSVLRSSQPAEVGKSIVGCLSDSIWHRRHHAVTEDDPCKNPDPCTDLWETFLITGQLGCPSLPRTHNLDAPPSQELITLISCFIALGSPHLTSHVHFILKYFCCLPLEFRLHENRLFFFFLTSVFPAQCLMALDKYLADKSMNEVGNHCPILFLRGLRTGLPSLGGASSLGFQPLTLLCISQT